MFLRFLSFMFFIIGLILFVVGIVLAIYSIVCSSNDSKSVMLYCSISIFGIFLLEIGYVLYGESIEREIYVV